MSRLSELIQNIASPRLRVTGLVITNTEFASPEEDQKLTEFDEPLYFESKYYEPRRLMTQAIIDMLLQRVHEGTHE